MGTEGRQRWLEMAEVSWSVRRWMQGHGARGSLSRVRLEAKERGTGGDAQGLLVKLEGLREYLLDQELGTPVLISHLAKRI